MNSILSPIGKWIFLPAGIILLLLGKTALGEHEVGYRQDLVMLDLVRYQELTIDLVYPRAAGSFPVIIFSHAEGGSAEDVRDLSEAWAKAGFITISPTHIDMVPIRPSQGLAQAAFPHFPSKSYQHQNAIQRVEDLKFIMDSLGDIQKSALPGETQADPERIGLAGISFGAYVAQLLGGTLLELTEAGEPETFTDPRPKSFLLISPQGAGDRLCLPENAWDPFTRPMMVITGGLDMGPGGLGGSWRKQPFERSPAGDKVLLWFDHGMTKSFINPRPTAAVPAASIEIGPVARVYAVPARPRNPPHQGIFQITSEATTLFWNCMLRDDTEARKALESQRLSESSNTEGVSYQFATR